MLDRNLDAEQQECRLDGCLFFSATKLARELGKLAEDAFLKTGLSPSHALLLYIVNLRGGIHQKEIGEMLHLTPSTITRLIEKLERKEFISKNIEGKNVYLGTTPEGLALQDEIVASWDRLNHGFLDILTEKEASSFVEISNKLLKALDTRKNEFKK